MIGREIAWRIFAGEYNQSRLELKGGGDRMPSYIVSPVGAMINRVFLVGVLTDLDNIGTGDEPLWRGRLQDPTGNFYISSGQYQPEATAILSKMEPPAFVAIVGKVRTYSPEEGTMYVSVRPEKVRAVEAKERDYWVLETCKATLRRIDVMAEAKKMAAPSVEGLILSGAPRMLAEGAVKALSFYRDIDLQRYRNMVVDALKFLLPEYQPEPEEDIAPAEVDRPEEIEDEEEAEAVQQAREDKVLAIITKLDKSGKGAAWDDIIEEVKRIGMDRTELEEITNSLLDKGLVYEPVLGRMKRI